jgi:hypothetical protein
MCVVAVYKLVVARSANATPSSMGLIGIANGEAVIRANPCRLCRVSSTLLHKSPSAVRITNHHHDIYVSARPRTYLLRPFSAALQLTFVASEQLQLLGGEKRGLPPLPLDEMSSRMQWSLDHFNNIR